MMPRPVTTVAFLVALFLITLGPQRAESASPCSGSSPDKEALKLAACGPAAKNIRATPTPQCCAQVKAFVRNPSCLCAILFSQTAKNFGVNPGIALSIPKRCGLHHRRGQKCGRYVVP